MASRSKVQAGKAFVLIEAIDKTKAILGAISKRFSKWGASLTATGTKLFAVGSTIMAPLLGASKVFASMGDELGKMSSRTGVSVESLSELGFAAEQSGASLDGLGNGLYRMRRRVANAATGMGPAKRALDEIGLSADQLTGLSVENQFYEIATALGKVGNESEAAQYGFEIFGNQYKELLPLLQQGASGMDALRQRARELGLTVSGEDAKAAEKFTDAMNELKASLKATFFKVGASIAGILTKSVGVITKIVATTGEWINRNRKMVTIVLAVGAGIATLGGVLISAGIALKMVALAISGVSMALGVLKGALLLVTSPFGLIVAAIAAAIYIGYKFSDTFRTILGNLGSFLSKRFSALGSTISKTFGGIIESIKAGDLQTAWDVLTTGLSLAWQQLSDFMMDVWEKVTTFAVEVWAGAISQVKTLWLGLQKEIASGILEMAGKDEMWGKVWETVLGVNVYEENQRTKRLNAQARAMGLATTENDPAAIVRKEYDSKIAKASEDAGKLISDHKRALEEANRERERSIAEQTQHLDAILAKIQPSKQEEIKDTFKDVEDFVLPEISLAPRSIQSLDKGSVEARRKFQENANRGLKDQLGVAQDQLAALVGIRSELQQAPVLREA